MNPAHPSSAQDDETILIASLTAAARAARQYAHAPYSGFSVGAALQTASGRIYTGCNIENASFGLTVCAERIALFKALSEGERQFQAVVIATDAPTPTPPCGACRQVLWEFCGDISVVSVGPQGKTAAWSLAALLPAAFDDRHLATALPSPPKPD